MASVRATSAGWGWRFFVASSRFTGWRVKEAGLGLPYGKFLGHGTIRFDPLTFRGQARFVVRRLEVSMDDLYKDVRRKVIQIFTELTESRTVQLDPTQFAHDADGAISSALSSEFGPDVAHDIAFHLSDWGADAAFMVAVPLFPERFTADEIREGVQQFLVHAPNHIAAAAQLAGWPIRDVFGVGLRLGD